MPLLVQADLQRKLRIWFHRLVISSLDPTGKSILSQYVSTVDRMIRIDNNLMNQAITLAAHYDGCSEDDIIDAIERARQNGIPRGRRATTVTHVLETLIARIARQSQADDRVRIDQNALQVLDFLHEWFQCQPPDQQQEQPGGAPAIIAQVLTQLGEPNVVLWTAYHSQKQASVFDKEVKFLVIDSHCNFFAQPIRSVGRTDPEIRNYSMEFTRDCQFEFKKSNDIIVSIKAEVSDRVIAISPDYLFFNPSSGRVNMRRSSAIPPGIFHLLAADPQLGPSCAAQVSQYYKYWIIGGLHNVSDPASQQTLESDLNQVPPDVTIHVEISRPDISGWFQHVLHQYVNSVGVNVDDIERLAQKMVTNMPPRTNPPAPPSIADLREEYFLRLALWLACELDLERVYVHSLKLDYIVRRDASDDEMDQEVRADLFAKVVVTNRASGAGVGQRVRVRVGLSFSSLGALIEVCALRRFPVQEGDWITLEGLQEFERILDRGWFDDTFECQGQQTEFRVAAVPVPMFRVDPGGLKFVGAGDTTSAVSFVYGCCTAQKLKRC